MAWLRHSRANELSPRAHAAWAASPRQSRIVRVAPEGLLEHGAHVFGCRRAFSGQFEQQASEVCRDDPGVPEPNRLRLVGRIVRLVHLASNDRISGAARCSLAPCDSLNQTNRGRHLSHCGFERSNCALRVRSNLPAERFGTRRRPERSEHANPTEDGDACRDSEYRQSLSGHRFQSFVFPRPMPRRCQ